MGMEACASARHWSRQLQALGRTVRLMPPAYVKPYVKRHRHHAHRRPTDDVRQVPTRLTQACLASKTCSTCGSQSRPVSHISAAADRQGSRPVAADHSECAHAGDAPPAARRAGPFGDKSPPSRALSPRNRRAGGRALVLRAAVPSQELSIQPFEFFLGHVRQFPDQVPEIGSELCLQLGVGWEGSIELPGVDLGRDQSENAGAPARSIPTWQSIRAGRRGFP